MRMIICLSVVLLFSATQISLGFLFFCFFDYPLVHAAQASSEKKQRAATASTGFERVRRRLLALNTFDGVYWL
jgi:hypothetical protein